VYNTLSKFFQKLSPGTTSNVLNTTGDRQPFCGGSDVFCRPSLSEGLGNSFLEAMAAEVPVVATPVGGIPDFLEEGVTGWFSKPRHPKMIADKIAYILEPKNAEDVQRVVRNAYKMILEKYTWEIVAERMKKVFETV
jgi:glycosyltransferase involved in cell wall biosynthesis